MTTRDYIPFYLRLLHLVRWPVALTAILSLTALSCSGLSYSKPVYKMYSEEDFRLDLELLALEVSVGAEFAVNEVLTNVADERRSAFLHSPKTLWLRRIATGETWAIRDVSIHDICASESRFSLDSGESLSFSSVVAIPNLPSGSYSLVGELTIAGCSAGGAQPNHRWEIRSLPVEVTLIERGQMGRR